MPCIAIPVCLAHDWIVTRSSNAKSRPAVPGDYFREQNVQTKPCDLESGCLWTVLKIIKLFRIMKPRSMKCGVIVT